MADRNPILPPVSDSAVQFDAESLAQKDQDQQVDINDAQASASSALVQSTTNKTSITNIINGTTPVPVASHTHNFDLLMEQDFPVGKWKSISVPNMITPPPNFAASATNYIFFAPFVVPKTFTIDQIGVRTTVANATSVLRVGMYDEVNGRPDTLLFDAGTISAATPTGEKTVSVSYTFQPGRYWAAAVWQALQSTAAINGFSVVAGGAYHIYHHSLSSALGAGSANPCFVTSANTYTSGALPSNTTNGTILQAWTSTNGLNYGPGLAFRSA
jgi:hypothetical protein